MRRSHLYALLFSLLLLGLAPACGGQGTPDDSDDEGSNPAGVGNICTEDDDCKTGECYQGPGGGYCTTDCNSEGSTAECPEDTVCKPIQGGPARCLIICGSDSVCGDTNQCDQLACPGGSSCVDVSDTNHQAC